MLLTAAKVPPSGAGWGHELKSDGWRGALRIGEGRRVQIISRSGNHWTDAFPTIRDAAALLPLKAALLDGEIAVLLLNGLTSFQALQHRTTLPAGSRLVFQAFDVIHLDGEDVGRLAFERRKAVLEQLLASGQDQDVLRYTPHIVGDGPRVFEHAAKLGVEGIVSKRLGSPYTPGRSTAWVKTKNLRTESFVLGGFTERPASASIGALLVGYHDGDGILRYAGHVGTGKGFTREFLVELRRRLAELEQPASPFHEFAPTSMRSAWVQGHALPTRWVQPLVACDIAFLEWTQDLQLRHASFRRLRPDLLVHARAHDE
jgi:bifunctional non-homologous end joining protein LigD